MTFGLCTVVYYLCLSEMEVCTAESLKLQLHCTADNSTTERDLICPNTVSTKVSDLKEDIQNKFKIPTCCQSLYFESTLLRDEDTLAQCWIREGDTIVLKYETVADIDDISEVVRILKQLLETVEEYYGLVTATGNPVSHTLQLGTAPKRVRDLVFSGFRDSSKRCDANRLHFVSKGGVQILYKLYRLTLKVDYKHTVFQLRYLESVLIQVIGSGLIDSSTRIPLLRQLVLDNSTLDYVLKSFTRILIPHRKEIIAPKGPAEQFPVPTNVHSQVLAMCLQMSQVNTSK